MIIHPISIEFCVCVGVFLKVCNMCGKKYVYEMGKLVGICLRCGEIKHENECKEEKTCEICDKQGHVALFCFKRISRFRNNRIVHNNISAHRNNHITPATSQVLSPETQPLIDLPIDNTSPPTVNLSRLLNPEAVKYASITPKNIYHVHPVYTCANTAQMQDPNTSSSLLAVVNIMLPDNNRHAFLLDSGSSISLIEQKIIDNLKVKGYYHPLTLRWTGDVEKSDEGSCVVRLDIKNLSTNKTLRMYFHTFNNLCVGDQPFNSQDMQKKYPYLQALQLNSYAKMTGIIGTDQAWAFTQHRVVQEEARTRKLSSPRSFGTTRRLRHWQRNSHCTAI
jgi:hypothetical protein